VFWQLNVLRLSGPSSQRVAKAVEGAHIAEKRRRLLRLQNDRGEVSERLKELASKASVGGTLPWVRIPPSPP
jgi:hypothetical protein